MPSLNLEITLREARFNKPSWESTKLLVLEELPVPDLTLPTQLLGPYTGLLTPSLQGRVGPRQDAERSLVCS